MPSGDRLSAPPSWDSSLTLSDPDAASGSSSARRHGRAELPHCLDRTATDLDCVVVGVPGGGQPRLCLESGSARVDAKPLVKRDDVVRNLVAGAYDASDRKRVREYLLISRLPQVHPSGLAAAEWRRHAWRERGEDGRGEFAAPCLG